MPPPPAHGFDDRGTVPVAVHDSRMIHASATVSTLDRRFDRLNVVQSSQSVDRSMVTIFLLVGSLGDLLLTFLILLMQDA